MPYSVIEEKLRMIPEEYLYEVSDLLDGIILRIGKVKKNKELVENKENISEKVNDFLKNNPTAFDEFKSTLDTNVKTVWELVKNDEW